MGGRGVSLMDAAKCYNARRRYSHNVPHEYNCPLNKYHSHSHCYVTESKFDCCKDTFKDFTVHLQHCRSARHIATMYGVDRVEVLRTARRLRVLEVLERA